MVWNLPVNTEGYESFDLFSLLLVTFRGDILLKTQMIWIEVSDLKLDLCSNSHPPYSEFRRIKRMERIPTP